MTRAKGLFITFEGGEGAGKSTQIQILAEHMRSLGHPVVTTREPGGSQGAEAIRTLLVTGDPDRWGALSEVFLLAAARADHLERTIRPALAQGAVVLCDRFMDSTTAYQGYGHGLDLSAIMRVHDLTVGPTSPDLTLLLDLPVLDGLKRAKGRGDGEDRFENMNTSFHDRLRAGFLALAQANAGRFAVIDAGQSKEQVADSIWRAVQGRLEGRAETGRSVS